MLRFRSRTRSSFLWTLTPAGVDSSDTNVGASDHGAPVWATWYSTVGSHGR